MKLRFDKYHALGNSFLVVETRSLGSRARWGKVAQSMCSTATGVGADGLLVVSPSKGADCRADVFNADGGWAERSGNGLRIVGLHLFRTKPIRKSLTILMGGEKCTATVLMKVAGGHAVRAAIGSPDFLAKSVPVKSRLKHLINQKIRIGREEVIATCLAVGNPHCVVPVDSFDFDWKEMGRSIEYAPIFPKRTNVEFVRVISRRKVRVAEWERGAGATGSSGTGAAAAVAAMVMLGRVDRECEVQFDNGSLQVYWDSATNRIELSGPVVHIASGSIEV